MSAPELFCEVRDQSFGFLGYLAIDRTVNGKSCGGIRFGPEVSAEEIQALGYCMSLKYGFANIRLGGAKSGLVAPFEVSAQERRERLLAFGRELAPLLRSRRYIPGADLGTSHEDSLTVLEGAGIRKSNTNHGERGGYYTGYGVVQAILLALQHLNIPVSGCSVAIEGFGKVGSTIGELLAAHGARVIAISTRHGGLYNPDGLNIERLLALHDPNDSPWIERYQDAQRITPAQLYTLPVDVVIPCAGPWMINESNVEYVQAKAVVAAANIPARLPIQQRLEARGILYLPDFMCNCRGILANTLEWRGFGATEIERFYREVLAAKMDAVLEQARILEQPPSVIAEALALENLTRLQGLSTQASNRRSTRLLDALRHPRQAVSYITSGYYRGKRPARELFAKASWQEAVRVFQDDADGWGSESSGCLSYKGESAQCV